MDLFKDILAKLLSIKTAEVYFPGVEKSIESMFESRCFQALNEIKMILEDKNLKDKECFIQISEIVNVFEALGGEIKERRDFSRFKE